MKTADWRVLINSREFWDTQSRRTACQRQEDCLPKSQSWHQRPQSPQASPQCCPQVRTAPYVELQGDPELRLCNSTAGPSSWWRKDAETARETQGCIASTLQRVRITYASFCPFLQLGHCSPIRPLLSIHTLSPILIPLALNAPARTHLLQAPSSIHWFIDSFGNPRNYCYYQVCWKYSLFSILLLLLFCCNKGSFTLQWSCHCCEQVAGTSGYWSILGMQQHSLSEHMGHRLPLAL